MRKFLYFIGLIQLWPFLIFFKTKTYYEDGGRKNKRIKGGAVIISNHRSFMDGVVIALKFFFKRLRFLVVDSYFQNGRRKLLKFIVKTAGGIFVGKDGRSFDYIEKTKRAAAKGDAVLIFPEGDFTFTDGPAEFTAGYIVLAIKTGAKIVPVVNDFNYGLFKRVHIMIGNAIDLSGWSGVELTKERLKEINGEISEKYLSLFHKLQSKKAERL